MIVHSQVISLVFDPPLSEAVLVRRYKRFLADIVLPDGSPLTIHCPNTGSMLNCGGPGSRIWYSTSANPKRKYPHTFELVETQGSELACINTHRANALVREALEAGLIPALDGYGKLESEVRYGLENSRVDFLLSEHSTDNRPCFVEVKSVTLSIGQGVGLFPDAVSTRGSKHLRELMTLAGEGKRAVLFFCVQHNGIDIVAPAAEIDSVYAATLQQAVAAGVEVMVWKVRVSPDELVIEREIPFQTSL